MSTPRHPNINYTAGWFFVTTQVARNKSLFGVIADSLCVLNDLGRRVESVWRAMPARFATLRQDAFVLMPNHFHAIVHLAPGTSPGATISPQDSRAPGVYPQYRAPGVYPQYRAPGVYPQYRTPGVHPQGGLSAVMGAFKSLAAREYLALLKARLCPDIGPHLWLHSFHDNLITSPSELENIRAYIRDNPARWDDDRFGPVTTHHHGNLDLLARPLTAFVASEAPGTSPGATIDSSGIVPPGFIPGVPVAPGFIPGVPVAPGFIPGGVISTFTSPEERAVLAWCLHTRTPFVHIYPGGIPNPLPQPVARACSEDRALLLSPVTPGTGVNKQRAIWCNRYVLSQAATIRTGTIRPGGSLETLLHARTPGAPGTSPGATISPQSRTPGVHPQSRTPGVHPQGSPTTS